MIVLATLPPGESRILTTVSKPGQARTCLRPFQSEQAETLGPKFLALADEYPQVGDTRLELVTPSLSS